MVVFEADIEADEFHGSLVSRNEAELLTECDVISANRMTEELMPVAGKIITQDLFGDN